MARKTKIVSCNVFKNKEEDQLKAEFNKKLLEVFKQRFLSDKASKDKKP
ncbi:hypothetical protein [Aminipila luticellarii]|nr:hypothetical protein [Aminipila luticellarii]